jgi:hypothetical protein
MALIAHVEEEISPRRPKAAKKPAAAKKPSARKKVDITKSDKGEAKAEAPSAE